MKKLLLILALAALVVLGCASPTSGGSSSTTTSSGTGTTSSSSSTFTLTYDANGATSGTVPTDSGTYKQGASATVLGNTGTLALSGYAFAGWTTNNTATGTSASYAAAAALTMGSANLTLYAVWIPNTFKFTASGTTISLTGYTSAPSGNLTIPPGVTCLSNYSFSNCADLITVSIPSSTVNILDNPFYMCFKLTTISVDSTNPNFSSGSGVLFNKSQTTVVLFPEGSPYQSFVIPVGVTSIGSIAFTGCLKLTAINIPDTVKTIENGAFIYCQKLTDVTIPINVTSMGSQVFYYCSGLASLTMKSENPPDLPANSQAFTNVAGGFKIHVPSSTAVIAYKGASGWSEYSSFIVTP